MFKTFLSCIIWESLSRSLLPFIYIYISVFLMCVRTHDNLLYLNFAPTFWNVSGQRGRGHQTPLLHTWFSSADFVRICCCFSKICWYFWLPVMRGLYMLHCHTPVQFRIFTTSFLFFLPLDEVCPSQCVQIPIHSKINKPLISHWRQRGLRWFTTCVVADVWKQTECEHDSESTCLYRGDQRHAGVAHHLMDKGGNLQWACWQARQSRIKFKTEQLTNWIDLISLPQAPFNLSLQDSRIANYI